MKLYLPFLILTSMFLLACRKECQHKKLSKIECSDGYDLIENISRTSNTMGFRVNNQPTYIINDSITYNSLTDSSYKPFDIVDFNTQTVLGREFGTNWADGISTQSYFCHNSANNTWKFTVEYSLSGQCHGSGISGLSCSFWVLCPKIPATDSVIFEVIDINPFPD